MATDLIFYYLTKPLGLLAIGSAIVIPFFIWRFLLGKSFGAFGIKPLAAGYVGALLGLVLLNFFTSYIEFTRRVDNGVLQEAARWATVPGWTMYTMVLSLLFVLPVLGLMGVPLTAFLLKTRRLSVRNMAGVLLFCWLLPTIALWLLPINEWSRTHRLEFLLTILFELVPGVLLIAVPFLGGVFFATRSSRNAGT